MLGDRNAGAQRVIGAGLFGHADRQFDPAGGGFMFQRQIPDPDRIGNNKRFQDQRLDLHRQFDRGGLVGQGAGGQNRLAAL